jgi:hypothetical protein
VDIREPLSKWLGNYLVEHLCDAVVSSTSHYWPVSSRPGKSTAPWSTIGADGLAIVGCVGTSGLLVHGTSSTASSK